MLYDPSMASANEALSTLESLLLKGFVGVRFNPYLWPIDESTNFNKKISEDAVALAVYKRCGKLKMPVGIMCFKGLDLHYDDVVALIESSPVTELILDHMGFTFLNNEGRGNSNVAFEELLSLAKYPNVYIKISALFRVAAGNDRFPYNDVKEKRFKLLLNAFGSKRLLFGTDFPYVLGEEGSYKGAVDTVLGWCKEYEEEFNEESNTIAKDIMGGNTKRLFGSWGRQEIFSDRKTQVDSNADENVM